jgi:hypothetical protein
MNAESFLLLFPGLLLGAPLLLGLRLLVNWMAGRKLIPLWLPLGLLIVPPVTGAIFLDMAGTVRTVKVVSKQETIQYSHQFHRAGYWSRIFSAQVENQQPAGANSAAFPMLIVNGTDFDAMRIGQTARVRVYELGGQLRFGRPADRSSFSLLTDWLPRSPRGPWREATATVEQINQFTEHVVRKPHSRTPLPWPYQIVRFSFTPPGYDRPIEAMDNIEIASLPNLAEKATVKITWPEDDPRSARIAGARPGAPWANWFYVFSQDLAIAAAVIGLFAIWEFIRRRRKRAVNNPVARG